MDSRHNDVFRADNRGESGSGLALKSGAKIIRPAVICLCFALSIQLIIREFF